MPVAAMTAMKKKPPTDSAVPSEEWDQPPQL